MSKPADLLIRAYRVILEDNDRSAARELHSFIRRRFKDAETVKKLSQVRREPRVSTVTTALKERTPRFKKKVVPSKREEVAVGVPKKQTKNDLTIDELLDIVGKGEEALIKEFGSVEAFIKYTQDRFEGIDYGRKSAFGSVTDVFKEYVAKTVEVEEEEVVDIFD